ncbi:hypothetical protein [Litorihabitans aurantiacus]|uniref:Uncharacterized protein n=1 Tax=Litorihabitans aurantiacus TaxID=1930061 RepID=A0AA37XG04_9MICO|nr:hypothetical protein [Litorihabitans aurantiacus]GMA32848.1 hypothetical protein GCM10025875_28400 [Litorihabitans aurantiacus]
MRLRLIDAQRRELLRAREAGAFSSSSLEAALASLDAQQIALESKAPAD